MSNVLILIDGFNFYHRLKDYQLRNNTCVKWLNYKQLMLKHFTGASDVSNKYRFIYFSALANHRGQACVNRHNTYIDALKTENIEIVLGQFKVKHIKRCSCNERCGGCNTVQEKTPLIKHEEKNTDVNIAITLVQEAFLQSYDMCYILSSDSDFYTAIEKAKQIHPSGRIILVPPPLPKNSARKNPYFISGIKNLTGNHPLFISWNSVINSQFPDTMGSITNPWIIP